MGQYSIKELEHLSGIKAHTIRIWEQRYKLLQPKRTETNIRFYDDSDLKLLLNVAALNLHGHKISKIACMGKAEITAAVLKLNQQSEDYSSQISQLKVAMIELNEAAFDKLFATAVLKFGFEKTIREIIYPFLEQIGVLWQTEHINPAHEHFISNLIRQKMIVALDGQVINNQAGKTKFILFLPEGELHELALLFMAYIIRSRHFPVLYLGQSLPFIDLLATAEIYKPSHLCSVFTAFPERDLVQDYLDQLAEKFPDSLISVCGSQMQNNSIHLPSNIQSFQKLQDFIDFIDSV